MNIWFTPSAAIRRAIGWELTFKGLLIGALSSVPLIVLFMFLAPMAVPAVIGADLSVFIITLLTKNRDIKVCITGVCYKETRGSDYFLRVEEVGMLSVPESLYWKVYPGDSVVLICKDGQLCRCMALYEYSELTENR